MFIRHILWYTYYYVKFFLRPLWIVPTCATAVNNASIDVLESSVKSSDFNELMKNNFYWYFPKNPTEFVNRSRRISTAWNDLMRVLKQFKQKILPSRVSSSRNYNEITSMARFNIDRLFGATIDSRSACGVPDGRSRTHGPQCSF